MSEHVQKTIDDLLGKIETAQQSVTADKRMVNGLCGFIGRPPIFADADLLPSGGHSQVRSDEYYGQPLATAIRMILDRRQLAKLGPASVNEIYDALIEGGYKFNTEVEEHARRGLYSSLAKNTAMFHKLPGGAYGLLSWYPGVKEPKPAKTTNGDKAEQVPPGEDEPEASEETLKEVEDLEESTGFSAVKPK